MDLTGLCLLLLTSGFFTAWLAARKGYSPRSWFWLGALLGLIAWAILFLQPHQDELDDDAATVTN